MSKSYINDVRLGDTVVEQTIDLENDSVSFIDHSGNLLFYIDSHGYSSRMSETDGDHSGKFSYRDGGWVFKENDLPEVYTAGHFDLIKFEMQMFKTLFGAK